MNANNQLFSSFQVDWILNHEITNVQLEDFEDLSVWKSSIKYNLYNNFEHVDSSIASMLVKNIDAILEYNSNNESLKQALYNFPKMYWMLNQANSDYHRIQDSRDSSRKKADKIIKVYSDIANGSFIESLLILQSLEQLCTDRKLIQSKLHALTTELSGKKQIDAGRDYTKYTNLISPDIRNASDHGGIEIRSNYYSITYTDKHKLVTVNKSFIDVENKVSLLLSGLSAFTQAMLYLISKSQVTGFEMDGDFPELVKSAWYRLQLSTLKVSCEMVEILPITNDRIQLSIELDGINASGKDKLVFCLQSAIYAMAVIIPKSKKFDRVFVKYSSSRAMDSFVAVGSDKIWDFLNGKISSEDLWGAAIGDGIMTFDTVEDPVPIQDIDYHDINTPDYKISNIKNPNLEDVIRFTADVEFTRASRPNHIKNIIDKIITQLRNLPSGGDEKMLTKHGLAPADVVFIRAFRSLDGSKVISMDNDNFIATIQYDINREFKIDFDNSSLFAFRKIRYEGDIEYGWNPSFGE